VAEKIGRCLLVVTDGNRIDGPNRFIQGSFRGVHFVGSLVLTPFLVIPWTRGSACTILGHRSGGWVHVNGGGTGSSSAEPRDERIVCAC
jgi:hypothetical protein